MPLIEQSREYLHSHIKSKNSCWLREQHDRVYSFPSSTTLRNPSDCSVLSHSLTRVYLVRATPSSKFLASLGTSDILKTLGDIALIICLIHAPFGDEFDDQF